MSASARVREGTLMSAGKLRADLEMSGLFRRAWTVADIQLERRCCASNTTSMAR